MKQFSIKLAGRLAAFCDRLLTPALAVALPNDLGAMFQNGIETLLIEPASTYLPVSHRHLLYKRGATGAGYCDVCGVSDLPLGVSNDSPYAAGDYLNIRRFGAKKGIEIAIAAGAITVDALVCTAADGKVQQLSTAGSGTFYVVGRAVVTLAATDPTMEIAFIPCFPYSVTQ